MGVAAPVTPARPAAAPPARSAWLFRWFRRYARRDLARHFHAVRLARAGRPPADPPGPLIVVLSHASLWDLMVGLYLTELFPGRAVYTPMDAAALAKYRFLGRLGAFGIEMGTLRGAAQFLQTSRAILGDEANTLWVTAQGRFTDVRQRPLRLRPGVGHLAADTPRGTMLPLALEYPSWTERTPEALARFGEPLDLAAHRGRTPREWTAAVEQALTAAMDALAADAIHQDPAAFETLISGRAGIGGVYDLWRRLTARLRGRCFRPEHGEEAP